MKLLFEGYPYQPDLVEKICNSAGEKLFVLKGDKAVFLYVGYFFSSSKDVNDAVFILPKVLIGAAGTDDIPLAFGKYNPERLINFDSSVSLQSTELPDKTEKEFISQLAIWLYQAICRYSVRQWQNTVTYTEHIADVLASRNITDGGTHTFLDIILQLFRFHKEHSKMFTCISLMRSGGRNNVVWSRTMSKKLPLLIDGKPFYDNFIVREKTINYDEKLIVLFYSVLIFLREKYHFKVLMELNYNLIPPHRIESMLNSQKGTRYLRSIRRCYFKDEFVTLWKLLYIFFEKAERIARGRYHDEKLLVHNFNLVFEDMVDKLLSDDHEQIPEQLKEQNDGKRVDHIYMDNSLTGSNEIYFIGDSKYYRDKNEIGKNSVYKQYTYAKNIIQFNIDLLNEHKDCLRYRDNLTEGYNITPNFFIRGKLDFNDLSPAKDSLASAEHPGQCEVPMMYQFENRLFDRDTLLIQTYNINFLYVMNAYISRGGNEVFRKKARALFRRRALDYLNTHYTFYLVKCGSSESVEQFINRFFRRLVGKMYRVSDDSLNILLAYEKDKDGMDEELRREIFMHWKLEENPVTLPLDSSSFSA